MLSSLTPKIKIKLYYNNTYCINNEPILTSTLAAGIVQDMFAGEAGEGEGGEEETTGGYFYRSGWKFFRFLALEHVIAYQKRTYVYIYTYMYKQNLDLDD